MISLPTRAEKSSISRNQCNALTIDISTIYNHLVRFGVSSEEIRIFYLLNAQNSLILLLNTLPNAKYSLTRVNFSIYGNDFESSIERAMVREELMNIELGTSGTRRLG